MVIHDLNLAARYADVLVALKDGRIVASGPPEDVLSEELLQEVFGLSARVVEDPVSGRPRVVPLGGSRSRRRPAMA
jgi:iron complex transport system ATP-binding protein